MRSKKQTISLLLAVVLFLGNFPAAVFAAEESPASTEPDVTMPVETSPAEAPAPTEAETEPAESTAAATEGAEETVPAGNPEDDEILAGDSEEVQTERRFATALEATIEQQIRAFADSIDKKDADDSAASALAKHGMTKGGKKLSVGKSHALTATLLNSEMMQAALVDTCTAAIRAMQQLDTQKLDNIIGGFNWYGAENSSYSTSVYDSLDSDTKVSLWSLCRDSDYSSPRNSYDESLDWIAGGVWVNFTVERINVAADATTYRVNLTAKDRFDFSISGNSFFKDLISGIGALLFREFDWESKVTFDLKVPYSCYHESKNYRFTYDAESKIMTCDSSDGWQTNDITRITYSSTPGAESYYHELAETVRLRHDLPWVMEFDVRNPGTFAFSPLRESSYVHPVLFNNSRQSLTAAYWEKVTVSQKIADEYGLSSLNQSIRHSYGTELSSQFKYSNQKIYTIRLENEIQADGSNMIYLTVWETETGKMELERIPMDDYYIRESWLNELQLRDTCDDWVSGKDFLINCIGYIKYRFNSEYFELRVWENGENGESVSYYQDKVTKPTCTARGYTTHTCALCGYAYKDSYVAKAGHSYGDWYVEKEAACTEAGTERRDCANCDHFETREIPAAGHDYEAVVTAPTCTEQGYTTRTCHCGDSYVDSYVPATGHTPGEAVRENEEPNGAHDLVVYCEVCGGELSREHVEGENPSHVPGDITGDGLVNNKDLTRLFRYLSGFQVEVNEAALDITGDGAVNNKDLTRLFRYLSGFNVDIR